MIELLATDLDGTILLRDCIGYRRNDVEALEEAGRKGIIRVIATGRTLKSAKDVIPAGFPVDYLVFSSGAGVYDWKNEKILQVKHLGAEKTNRIVPLLKNNELNFTLHWPIPDNHCFYYAQAKKSHNDFDRFITYNEKYAHSLNEEVPEKDYTQVLAFLPDVETYERIASKVDDVKTVRATSPIDGKSVWMEFFCENVSKAEGIRYVCEIENVNEDNVAVVGNDFNDLDMLNAFKNSFVVADAPLLLKEKFSVTVPAADAPLMDVSRKLAIL
ncbi:MAG: HAD family phosphatase [Chlorobi bacterium]|nr:HAD family phosphatase [Chlorobiota bacterium]